MIQLLRILLCVFSRLMKKGLNKNAYLVLLICLQGASNNAFSYNYPEGNDLDFPEPSTLRNTQKQELFIVISGYLSCKATTNPLRSELFQNVSQLMQNIEQQTNQNITHYLVGCFRTHLNKIYLTEVSPNGHRKTRLAIREVGSYVNNWLSQFDNYNLNLLGSSYGGWMVIDAAKDILAPEGSVSSQNGNNINIFTIDPISRTFCAIEQMWESVSNAQPQPGCTQSPPDWHDLSFGMHVRKWLNFYQDATTFLHSSPSPVADENHLIEFTNGVAGFLVGHGMILHQPTVWEHVETQILSQR